MNFKRIFINLDMQRILISLLALFCFQFIVSQTNHELDFKKKKNYVSIKNLRNQEKKHFKDYLILDNDTLVNLETKIKIKNVDKFCKYFNNDKAITTLSSAIQYYLPKNSRVAKSRQWNSEILVYIDKSIPKTTRKAFKSFFSQIDSIENFKISFSKSISKANYLIKVSDTIIPNYKSKKREYDDNYPISKGVYKALIDSNDKIYTCATYIDKSIIKNKKLSLKKLKQLFFFSLGQFTYRKSFPKESLLNLDYKESKKVSEFDINLLKLHYYKIYPRSFDRADLMVFKRKAKSICKNE